MKYLSVDYGRKRTGIAISDQEGRIAFPHSVIETSRSIAEDILEVAERESVEAFVLGNSIDGNGNENPVMQYVHTLAEALRAVGPVVYEDERYSSQHALRGHEENAMHDASTAAIILQSYLDRNNKKASSLDPYVLPEA